MVVGWDRRRVLSGGQHVQLVADGRVWDFLHVCGSFSSADWRSELLFVHYAVRFAYNDNDQHDAAATVRRMLHDHAWPDDQHHASAVWRTLPMALERFRLRLESRGELLCRLHVYGTWRSWARRLRNRLDALPDHHDADNHHVLSGSGRIQVRQNCLHRRSVDDRLRMFRGNARRSEPAVHPGRRIVLWVRRGYVCLRDLRNDNANDQHHDNQHDDNDHALPIDQLPLHLVRNGLEPRIKLRGRSMLHGRKLPLLRTGPRRHVRRRKRLRALHVGRVYHDNPAARLLLLQRWVR